MYTSQSNRTTELAPGQKDRRDTGDTNKLLNSYGGPDSSQDNLSREYEEHMDKLKAKFKKELQDVNAIQEKPEQFKNHQLPLARIKKIMKSDEDVKMISAEAPILFAKACELFIMDVTFRALFHTNYNKRKTLQKSDIASTVGMSEMFDFLIDVIPREEPDKDFLAKREADKTSSANMYRLMPKSNMLDMNSSGLMRNPLSNQFGQTRMLSNRYEQPHLYQPDIEQDKDLDRNSQVSHSLFGSKKH